MDDNANKETPENEVVYNEELYREMRSKYLSLASGETSVIGYIIGEFEKPHEKYNFRIIDLIVARYISRFGGSPNRAFEEAYEDALIIAIKSIMDPFEAYGFEFLLQHRNFLKKSGSGREFDFFSNGRKLEDLINFIQVQYEYHRDFLPEVLRDKVDESKVPILSEFSKDAFYTLCYRRILEILREELERRKQDNTVDTNEL